MTFLCPKCGLRTFKVVSRNRDLKRRKRYDSALFRCEECDFQERIG